MSKRSRRGPKDRHSVPPVGQSAQERRSFGPSAGLIDGATPTSRSGLLTFGPPGLTWREIALVSAVLSAGVILRLVAFSRSAVEHFDEGVYASNIYFGGPEYAYPQQRFYAPPLLPALIEAGMIVGLPPNVAALLPGFLAGCATIGALWWFGRIWFGPGAGIAAATLAALSDFHIGFSATALTDVLLGLWLVLAIDAMGRSLHNTDLRWAVGAGIYTGLAWWTKYNGWLPLAIEAATLVVLTVFFRASVKQLTGWIACFAVTALVAAVVWSPYYISLQSQGGYGPIAANHARYVVGLGGWLDSAARQLANPFVIEHMWSKLGAACAVTLPYLLVRQTIRASLRFVLQALAVGALAVFLTAFVVAAAGAVLGFARVLLAFRRAEKLDETWRRRAIGLSLVMLWWGGLLVATPLYTPYPRLVLPWLLAAWLGMAINFADFWPANERLLAAWDSGDWKKPTAFFALLVGVCVVFALWRPHPQQAELGLDRRGIERLAGQIRTAEARGEPRVIYVCGEPAVFFQLGAAGEEVVAPIQDIPNKAATLDGRDVPTFLIVGPHAERDSQFQQQWPAAEAHWKLATEYEYVPSALVWLDSHDPQAAAEAKATTYSLRLYEFQP